VIIKYEETLLHCMIHSCNAWVVLIDRAYRMGCLEELWRGLPAHARPIEDIDGGGSEKVISNCI
jgi:hypothetical protein